jgi:hypothetical protein
MYIKKWFRIKFLFLNLSFYIYQYIGEKMTNLINTLIEMFITSKQFNKMLYKMSKDINSTQMLNNMINEKLEYFKNKLHFALDNDKKIDYIIDIYLLYLFD